jgi:hypothetical protein
MRAPSVAAAVVALTLPAAAAAQLGLPLPPLPDPTQTVTDTTGQVTDALPDPLGGVVDTVTGDVGGVVNTVTDTTSGVIDPIGDTVDDVLGGTLGELPTGTIDDLLGAAGLNGRDGAPGTPGVTILPNGTVLVDSRPPVTSVKVLNRTRQVGRTGRLSIRIASDEPSVVAVTGSVRPGIARNRRIARHHSRKPIKFPRVVLAYRRAGALKLTIQFSRKAQRRLRNGYNARLTLSLIAVDVARNQQKRTVKRIVKH